MADYDSEYYEANDQAGDRPALGFYYRFFKNQMSRKLSGDKPLILEYGCGVGHLTKKLVRDFECYALDISDYALSQVNKHAPAAKTLKNLNKIKDESLDGVIALHVMEHIAKPEEVFRQFYNKLKPEGVLVFVVPNPDGFGCAFKKEKWFGYADKTHVSLFGVERWLEEVKKGGFHVTKFAGDGMWDVPYFPSVPTALQKLFFYPPAAAQVVTGKTFLPTKLGECLIVVAGKTANGSKAASASRGWALP